MPRGTRTTTRTLKPTIKRTPKRSVGRPKKYSSEEERMNARRVANQKAYQKRKRIAEQKKIDKEEFDDTWNAMMNMESIHTRTRNDELKEEIRILMNRPITYSTTKSKKKKNNEQFERMAYAISHNERSFDIEFPNRPDDTFLNRLGSLMDTFLNTITYNTRWLVLYRFQGKWRIRKLDDTTSAYFRTQMSKEGMVDMIHDYITYTEDYDFFPVSIKSLQQLRVVNLDRYDINDDEDVDADEVLRKTTNKPKTRKRRREGMFWGWTLTIPDIDLSRYMIFNRLDMNAAKMIESDNCLIYACKMSGVDEDTLTHMRNVIQTRSFTIEKLKDISRECDIHFIVRDEGKRKHSIMKGNGRHTVRLVLMHNHYMIDERVPVSPYYIQHMNDIRKMKQVRYWKKCDKMLISGINGKGIAYKTKDTYSIIAVIKTLFATQSFKPIRLGDYCTFMSCIREEKILPMERLEYSDRFCCRLKQVRERKIPVDKETKHVPFKRQHICYFDFECSTDGTKHLPYCVCNIRSITDANGDTHWIRSSWYSSHCATDFLDSLDTNTLCYAHNLSYDINFLIHHMTYIHDGAIIKSGRVMQMTAVYKQKTLMFKDTYSIISTKLSRFPSMFHLDSGVKEAFPYTYYDSTRIGKRYGSVSDALQHFRTDTERDTFISNIEKLGMRTGDEFDMKKYCVFYCNQDVNILYQGFEWFRSSLIDAFGLDTYDFISISSIANRYMEQHCYWKNGNLYDISNTPREFISRCIIGGRCMIADNEKQKSNDELVDFDAVSLYPSAMNRLYCLEGMPKVIPDEMLTSTYLMNHLFTDQQTEPTTERYISAFFVEIDITSIGIHRHFPLIVSNDEEHERSSNVCCTMYVDHIQLEDLVRYQRCECRVIRGYYYDGRRDTTIQNVISDLFEMRLKYKRDGNPLQEIIKLLLNSIYGKTILKPITDTVRFIPKTDTIDYFDRRYNHVKEIEDTMDRFCKVTETKSITRHFTFTTLGVNILSMSKRIMNEVMCLAEDLGMKVYYQDTDSMHIKKDDLERLSVEYGKMYGRELIGKCMGQFHSDFPTVGGIMPIAKRSIFCGKKCYIDELHGETEVAYHVRMKGIPLSVVVNKANEMYSGSAYIGTDGLVYNGNVVYRLYEELYNGTVMDMDLANGDSPCFERGKAFSVRTKDSFVRSIHF